MKSKLSWAPFIPLALLACFLKLAQGLLPEGAVLGLSALQLDYLFMAAVALIFLFALLFCLTDQKISTYYLPHRNFPAGVIGLLLALLLASDGAFSLFRAMGAGKTDILNVLGAVLSLLSAIVFVVLGLNHSFRNKEAKRFALLNVMPALLCGVRMILCFVQFTTISIRLADVSSLICYIFATLFFFNYAVALSLTKTKNAVKSCFIFGFPAVAALVSYGVYRLWFAFDAEIIMNNLQPLEMLLFGLYIFSFMIELTVYVRDKDSVVVITEEKPAANPDAKVEGFLANALTEDENDKSDDTSYLESRDTDDFLYQEIRMPEDNPEVNEAVHSDADGYLTEVIEEVDAEDSEDGRPKDYESRLDEIDKLILEISSQSD